MMPKDTSSVPSLRNAGKGSAGNVFRDLYKNSFCNKYTGVRTPYCHNDPSNMVKKSKNRNTAETSGGTVGNAKNAMMAPQHARMRSSQDITKTRGAGRPTEQEMKCYWLPSFLTVVPLPHILPVVK
jgi:hypothetical protein